MAEQHRILIVDDEPSVLLTYQMILRQQGYSVAGAVSAADATALLAEQQFDLIICDLQLETPEAGFHVIAAARRQHPEVPAILLTGYAERGAAETAEQRGIRVMFKPVDVQEFLPAVERMLGDKPGQSPA